MTMTRRRAVVLLSLLCLGFAFPASGTASAPRSASATNVIDHDVVALASDRDRYAVWGTLDGRIGTYDGRSGTVRHVSLSVPCPAPAISDVHGAEAIVNCSPSPFLLVELAAGRATVLGAPWVAGQATPQAIGKRWIRGIVECPASSHLCDQYVDRSTGAASVRPRSAAVYDLDVASRPRVERCASATKDFATMTSAWPWNITGGGGDPVWLGRCGHGKVLLTKDGEMSGVAVGPRYAIWHDPSSAWVRDLTGRQTLRWRPAGVVDEAVTAGRHVLIADKQDDDTPSIGYVANLLLATIPAVPRAR
jgi:hypothetical protein